MNINLIPPEERPLRPSAIRGEFVAAVIGICLLTASLGFAHMERVKVRNFTAQLEQMREYQQMLQRQVRTVQDLRGEIQELEAMKASLEELHAQPLPAETLNSILRLLGNGIWAEHIITENNMIRITGYSQSMASLTLYVNYLEDLGLSVRIANLNPDEAGGYTTFTLEIKEVV